MEDRRKASTHRSRRLKASTHNTQAVSTTDRYAQGASDPWKAPDYEGSSGISFCRMRHNPPSPPRPVSQPLGMGIEPLFLRWAPSLQLTISWDPKMLGLGLAGA